MVSQLVKHTDFISALSTSIRMLSMVVVKLWSTHPTHARFAHVSWTSWSHVGGCWHPWWSARASHVRRMRSLSSFSSANLCHSANASTSQPRILIAISPTVHSSLNQTSLAAKTRVQFGQSPPDGVTFSLVHQSISAVLVLVAASARIHAILSLELGVEMVHVH